MKQQVLQRVEESGYTFFHGLLCKQADAVFLYYWNHSLLRVKFKRRLLFDPSLTTKDTQWGVFQYALINLKESNFSNWLTALRSDATLQLQEADWDRLCVDVTDSAGFCALDVAACYDKQKLQRLLREGYVSRGAFERWKANSKVVKKMDDIADEEFTYVLNDTTDASGNSLGHWSAFQGVIPALTEKGDATDLFSTTSNPSNHPIFWAMDNGQVDSVNIILTLNPEVKTIVNALNQSLLTAAIAQIDRLGFDVMQPIIHLLIDEAGIQLSMDDIRRLNQLGYERKGIEKQKWARQLTEKQPQLAKEAAISTNPHALMAKHDKNMLESRASNHMTVPPCR